MNILNIKIKGFRRECKKKGIILIKRQKDKIETTNYSKRLGCDYSSATTSHSYHIFITIITLANNKTKEKKQNREANGTRAEKKKKNCPQQSRRAEEEEEEKETERARSYLD
jgi:hypothetical protein